MFGKISKGTILKGKIAGAKMMSDAGYQLGRIVRNAGQGLGKIGTVLGDTLKVNAKKTLKSSLNIASSFLKEDKKNSLIGYRLKKRGFALAAGLGVASTAVKETNSYFKEDLRGKQDGYTTPFAPSMKVGSGYGSFGQQAGATGDLVFALNRNRRG